MAATLPNAPFWHLVTTLTLRDNMRLLRNPHPDSLEFAAWLLAIGEGRIGGPGVKVPLASHHVLPPSSTQTDLVHCVYGDVTCLDMCDFEGLATFFSARAVLAPYNSVVNDVNDSVIDSLPGEERTYLSADKALFLDGNMDLELPEEFVNTIDIPGFPAHRLRLKVGCPVILLRNLDPPRGLCNGTRMIVTEMRGRVLGCRVVTGAVSREDRDVLLPRIKLSASPTNSMPFSLHRTQFPLRLAFAMTINKAQGQSLDIVGLELQRPVFSHGQLYVGLSRATRPDSLSILLPSQHTYESTNIVYHEVLDNECAWV